MQDSQAKILVEVVYALPAEQIVVPLNLVLGATVREAIELSGLPTKYPEIALLTAGVGIFGKAARPDTRLRDRDRVEIYRPLAADPKEARRARQVGSKP
jgi:putative ubiquitin-RnfH superfamily antitoxin RatB of RatAB toxin-antitoxin module